MYLDEDADSDTIPGYAGDDGECEDCGGTGIDRGGLWPNEPEACRTCMPPESAFARLTLAEKLVASAAIANYRKAEREEAA